MWTAILATLNHLDGDQARSWIHVQFRAFQSFEEGDEEPPPASSGRDGPSTGIHKPIDMQPEPSPPRRDEGE